MALESYQEVIVTHVRYLCYDTVVSSKGAKTSRTSSFIRDSVA